MTDPHEHARPRYADHFSAVADAYARFRPGYPDALLAWVAAQAPARRQAWDCGTGNGQAAIVLAAHFERVVATDTSVPQLAAAPVHPRVRYAAAAAERSPLADGSCDAITVAQALHWFDAPGFYGEARRVLRPAGVLAAWSYGLMTVEPAIDRVIGHLYYDVLGPHWPPERRLVEAGYRDVPFPAPELRPPAFHLERRWTLAETLGYVGTWSAVRGYRAATAEDPLPAFARRLADAWGDATAPRVVRWPLALRAARLNGG